MDWIWLAVSVFWVVVYAAVAGAAYYRFRATPSGILIGGAFALLAVKLAAMQAIQRIALADRAFADPTRLVIQSANWILTAVLLVAAVVGVALIPLSLARRDLGR
jgi:DNA-binding transcriptional LysR family regulator